VLSLHDLEAIGAHNQWFGMRVAADAPVVARYALHDYPQHLHHARLPDAGHGTGVSTSPDAPESASIVRIRT